MGSLSVFAEGSSHFAIDSGSALVDFFTGIPAFALWVADMVGFDTSLDLTASLHNGSPLD
ncbi:hypothetical protein [Dietzia massiliensis]|uniref:hypothetical protein n=1 Tax=Dietzia massiliensis TaxID=2697499 RepID=UPI001BD0642D|nr:hypothetical protein [Dietzia massiliensis]MBS7547647.1 hypothetical protein [Dietzia massiliensis]